MKELVVISGKGGTGKTSISSAFALLGGSEIVVADCDVDAADMHLLLQPDWSFSEDFYSGEAALIDQDKCLKCGKCQSICRFNAIAIKDNKYMVNNLNCEGCGYCYRICPAKAIDMQEQMVGKFYISNTKAENKLVHARLKSGADNSGKLVAKVKREAKIIAEQEQKAFVVVDGSPGIGCPVVSSLSGADYVVLVTEPTVSGLHDLYRVHQLVKKFDLPSGCIINKADINKTETNKLLQFLADNNIDHLGNIPYNEEFTAAMTAGRTIVENPDSHLADLIIGIWNEVIINTNKRS